MFRFYTLAFIFLGCASVLLLFQAIASVATAGEAVWKSYTILDLVSREYVQWIDTISQETVRTALKTVLTTPVDRVLLGCSGLFFVLGFIFKR